MSEKGLWFCIIQIFICSGIAVDVPFVFEESSSGLSGFTSAQLIKMSASSQDLKWLPQITSPSDEAIIPFTNTGGGSGPDEKVNLQVGEVRKTLNNRVELKNETVHLEALRLAGKYSGDYTIAQVSSIFSDLKDDWHYVRDTRGIDNFNSATQSIYLGKYHGCSGAGDCDDFSILMAALIESIGGTTRVILARNNTTGGHAYTEVYLGQLDSDNNHIDDIVKWLKDLYETDKIFAHIETDTKEVWLNLDWGKDVDGNAHPGGPLYPGDMHIVARINPNATKTAVNLPEKINKLPKIISLIPDKSSPQRIEATVTWTVQAKDPENDELLYRFLLNGDPVSKWTKEGIWIWKTTEDDVGDNQIEVRLRDGKHAGPEKYDVSKVERFSLEASMPVVVSEPENQPPILNNLRPNRVGPLDSSMSVTWTSDAVDPNGDQMLYRFYLNGWPVTNWSTDSIWTTCAWGSSETTVCENNTAPDVGENQIEVRIRDGWHADEHGFDDSRSANFAISLPEQPSDFRGSDSVIDPGHSISASEDDGIIGGIKRSIGSRVEPENSRVRDYAVVLASKFPGDFTINQIDSIYNYLKYGDDSIRGWQYIRDPKGMDYISSANESLELGSQTGSTGAGDCDDLAVLISSVIEAIGGTTRIILAKNNSVGDHAYAEVYLGQLNAQDNQIDEIIDWLKQKYNADRIYTHIDSDTNDVWLNLDWGTDGTGSSHPGGPFFPADRHTVIYTRNQLVKTPLKLNAQ
jgi:uncharacterized protein YciU (UPF0263 family)